eukprot:Amastigsp_a844761_35.p4 type:complete len:214 gc:universal Amastigsp_a844761_35:795-154(-)
MPICSSRGYTRPSISGRISHGSALICIGDASAASDSRSNAQLRSVPATPPRRMTFSCSIKGMILRSRNPVRRKKNVRPCGSCVMFENTVPSHASPSIENPRSPQNAGTSCSMCRPISSPASSSSTRAAAARLRVQFESSIAASGASLDSLSRIESMSRTTIPCSTISHAHGESPSAPVSAERLINVRMASCPIARLSERRRMRSCSSCLRSRQ